MVSTIGPVDRFASCDVCSSCNGVVVAILVPVLQILTSSFRASLLVQTFCVVLALADALAAGSAINTIKAGFTKSTSRLIVAFDRAATHLVTVSRDIATMRDCCGMLGGETPQDAIENLAFCTATKTVTISVLVNSSEIGRK